MFGLDTGKCLGSTDSDATATNADMDDDTASHVIKTSADADTDEPDEAEFEEFMAQLMSSDADEAVEDEVETVMTDDVAVDDPNIIKALLEKYDH